MALIIGTDEAGYGPNLGPLVIAATAWRVPDAMLQCDLYEVLSACVTEKVEHSPAARLAIADSKQLYKPGGTLGNLERAIHVGLRLVDRSANSWRAMWHALDARAALELDALAWHVEYDEPLPLACDVDEVSICHDRLRTALANCGIELVALRAVAIFPAAFNQRVRQLGSKGVLLTETTLQLAAELIGLASDSEPVRVLCDKHGGRNCYAAALTHGWPDSWAHVVVEGRQRSAYRLQVCGSEVEFAFQVGGEEHLPSAYASMTAKLLRELAMRPFNAFWCRRVKDLRPTAGYPSDAERFYKAIARERKQLKMEDDVIWRCR
jgi:hypothetical protein